MLYAGLVSFLVIGLTGALALAGIGTAPTAPAPAAQTTAPASISVELTPSSPVILDPYAKDQILASESPSASSPALSPTRPLASPSAASTAPATTPRASLRKRISAIFIERPVTTVTAPAPPPETVIVEAPRDEEEIVEEAETEVPVEAGVECVPPPGSYNGVRPDIAIVGAHIQELFNVTAVVGKAGRSGPSDHPGGRALDFMTNTGNVDGDAIRTYLLDNAEALGIKYVIWEQAITFPGGEPRGMEDRGNDTANHFDHVHASFLDTPGTLTPTC